MSKITHTTFALLLLLFLGNTSRNYAAASAKATAAEAQSKPSNSASQPARRSLDEGGTGTLQKMIVENGSVSMNLDLNRLNGINSASQNLQQAHFAVGANSFFPILVFNDLLRGPEPGSMALIPSAGVSSVEAAVSSAAPPVSQATRLPLQNLPSLLGASFNRLVIEKLPSGQGFDLAVRDGNTGFTFFNIEGHQYDYDPAAKSLAITGGRLLISKEFANALGRPSDASAVAGTISVGAAMQPIQIDQLVNGETKSMVMPPMQGEVGPAIPNLVPGPDVIVGNVQDVAQMGNDGTQVGLGNRNRLLQQRRPANRLVCFTSNRSSGRSTKSLSHERGRR